MIKLYGTMGVFEPKRLALYRVRYTQIMSQLQKQTKIARVLSRVRFNQNLL